MKSIYLIIKDFFSSASEKDLVAGMAIDLLRDHRAEWTQFEEDSNPYKGTTSLRFEGDGPWHGAVVSMDMLGAIVKIEEKEYRFGLLVNAEFLKAAFPENNPPRFGFAVGQSHNDIPTF